MTQCFADTFFFLSLVNQADKYHALALAANRVNRPIMTTEWVLVELADHLCDSRNRALYLELRVALRKDRRFTVLPVDQHQLEEGTRLYESRPDKDWSLTDCISFTVMQEHGLYEALTGDKHFEQAGFVALLK